MKFKEISTHLWYLVRLLMRPVADMRAWMLFCALMSWVTACCGRFLGASTDPFLSFLLPIGDCYIVCVITWLLRKIRLGWVAIALVGALLVGELFTVFYYHSLYSLYVVQLIMQTNTTETSELIESAITLPGTWVSVILTLAMIAIAVLVGRWSRRTYRGKSAMLFVVFAMVTWSCVRQVSGYKKLAYCFNDMTVEVCMTPSKVPHLNTPFIRFLYGLAFNMAQKEEMKGLPQSVEASQVDSCSFKTPLIVLIIGESYNKHHTPLYEPGYLPTTPRLLQRKNDGELCVYTDAVSPFNFTAGSFKYMFTTWDDTCADDWTQHTFFTAIFKKAGYKVHFVTNQFTINSTDIWDIGGGAIFNLPKLSELQFTTRNDYTCQYDGDLMKQLPPLDTLTSSPTLLIFHLMGQHVQYNNKFPPEFAHFKSSDERTPYGGEQGKQIAADYDNAVYYNDFVVDSLFRMLEKTEALAIYLSDHGEEAYDWRDKFERTSESELVPEVAHYQYEIPLMFYMTKGFKENNAELAQQIWACKDRPFISTDLCQILFYLAGVSTPEYRENHNILSPQYDMHRKRIIGFDVDYDELMKRSKLR